MRIGDEVVDAQRSERTEPEQHDRAKEGADGRRAAFLHEEQAEEDQQRDRNHIAVQLRRDDLEALDGGQNGDRRGHHAITVEHRRPEHTDDGDDLHAAGIVLGVMQGQRDQRHDAALAAVVGTHDDRYVLQRNDDDERPEEQRQAAKHIRLVERDRVIAGEDFLHRIERRSPDIAIDDPQCRKCDAGQRLLLVCGRHQQTAIAAAQPADTSLPSRAPNPIILFMQSLAVQVQARLRLFERMLRRINSAPFRPGSGCSPQNPACNKCLQVLPNGAGIVRRESVQWEPQRNQPLDHQTDRHKGDSP